MKEIADHSGNSDSESDVVVDHNTFNRRQKVLVYSDKSETSVED
jgi:hypothetical protein